MTSLTDPGGDRARLLTSALTINPSSLASVLATPSGTGLTGAISSSAVAIAVTVPWGLTTVSGANPQQMASNVVRTLCAASILIYQAECTLGISKALASQGILASGSTSADQQCRDANLGGATYNYWDKHANFSVVARLPVASLVVANQPGSTTSGYFVYRATGLNNTSFFKWKAQLVDIDGQLGVMTNCTTVTLRFSVLCGRRRAPLSRFGRFPPLFSHLPFPSFIFATL